MSGPLPSWPLALVTGMLGSGKTTLISRLLRHPGMADTLVLVNEFGEVGLDHDLIRAVSDNVVLLPNGCLCCTIRDDIVQTLRGIQRGWLAGTVPDFGRVVVETTGLAEPAPLIATIAAHPIVADHFALSAVATVVDAQHAGVQMADSTTCRNQIRLADHLLVSKTDLVDAGTTTALLARLAAANALASVGQSQRIEPDALFRREAALPLQNSFFSDETGDHLAGVTTAILRPAGPLEWTAFKVWLGGLLEACGLQLLRLKGRLTFAGHPAPLVVQAVHHTFYPVVEAPARGLDDVLVLIFDGPLPFGERFGTGPFVMARPGRSGF